MGDDENSQVFLFLLSFGFYLNTQRRMCDSAKRF